MWKFGITWIIVIFAVTNAGRVLDEYIRHYEELTYDTSLVHEHHLRAKRSTSDHHVHIEFSAHGRNFNLRLRRDTQTLHPNFKLVDDNDKELDFDRSLIYEGSLWGEPDTLVFGSIIDGVFSGKIVTPDDTYYVERAFYHFKGPQKFHSIIYADHDVNPDPFRLKREAEASAAQCGSSVPRIHRFLREHSQVVQQQEPVVKREANQEEKVQRKASENIYSESLNRQKRATVPAGKTCSLYLQTDPLFWSYFKGELGTTSEQRIREEIATLLAAHIREVRSIYEGTRFKHADGGVQLDYSGISFTVYRMKINTSAACDDNDATNDHPFCKKNIDVTNFLNYNAYQDHDDYCLAYVFTYRDFSGGTLGLAWVGSPSSSAGGICEKYKVFQEGTARTKKSLNTGIVSILNYGKRVAPKVSYLTLAHEIGHNFGSSHDQKSQCIPFTSNQDPSGNYIMFASATSGDRPNNRLFSPCSITNMSAVIDAVMQTKNGKANCFISGNEAFCGNGIVEKGEECDCGYHGDCNDKCCVARDTPNTALDAQCKRSAGAQCSPSEGPCCDKECQYISSSANMVCLKAAGCANESTCAGGSASCPSPVPKANGTSCNDNTQTCQSGQCLGSICSKIPGWEECFLTTKAMQDKKTFDVGDLCYVSCKQMGNGSTCWSSQQVDDSNFPSVFKTMLSTISGGSAIPLPAGAPCDDFQGYCDVFSKCRGVDADGPLARLKNLLFNPDTLEQIKNWVTEYWWAVALMIIAFILLMALFIKVCAVHTPSSNPNKKPARKLSAPHRRAGPSGQQGAPPQSRGRPPPDYYPQAGRGGPPPGHGQGRGGHRPEKVEMKQRRV